MRNVFRIGGRLRRGRVIVFYRHPAFARKAEAFTELLRAQGIDARLRTGLSFTMRARLAASDDTWVGFWYRVPVQFLPARYVFVNTEPLSVVQTSGDTEWFEAMKHALEVWGYRQSDREYVEPLGVPFCFVPLGYAPHYESSFRAHTARRNLVQDIDVLFFGNLSERRQRMLDELERHGFIVHTVGLDDPRYGAELDVLLARSRIVLGIHQYDDPKAHVIDLGRLDVALSNGLFVLHEEPAPDVEPELQDRVATCGYERIPEMCAHYLANPEARASSAAASREWFTNEMRLDSFIPFEHVFPRLRQQ